MFHNAFAKYCIANSTRTVFTNPPCVNGLSGAYFLLKNVSAHDDSNSARFEIAMLRCRRGSADKSVAREWLDWTSIAPRSRHRYRSRQKATAAVVTGSQSCAAQRLPPLSGDERKQRERKTWRRSAEVRKQASRARHPTST